MFCRASSKLPLTAFHAWPILRRTQNEARPHEQRTRHGRRPPNSGWQRSISRQFARQVAGSRLYTSDQTPYFGTTWLGRLDATLAAVSAARTPAHRYDTLPDPRVEPDTLDLWVRPGSQA